MFNTGQCAHVYFTYCQAHESCRHNHTVPQSNNMHGSWNYKKKLLHCILRSSWAAQSINDNLQHARGYIQKWMYTVWPWKFGFAHIHQNHVTMHGQSSVAHQGNCKVRRPKSQALHIGWLHAKIYPILIHLLELLEVLVVRSTPASDNQAVLTSLSYAMSGRSEGENNEVAH